LLALSGELLLDGPWPCPNGRVFDGDLVGEAIGAGPRPALDQMQALARASIIGFRTEIGDIDDEGIALPAATRVAIPLADTGRQVGACVHDDIPLPPLPLAHVVEHRDAAGGLHDPPEAPAEGGSEFGQPKGQAAISQSSILWTVEAIDARGA